jgi:hypothetical protein
VDVLDLDLRLAVGEHQQRGGGDRDEVVGRERGRAVVLGVEARPDVGPVVRAVRRDLGVEATEEREQVLGQRVEDARPPAVVVEDALGEHEPGHEIRAAQRDEQPDQRPDRVPDEVRRPPTTVSRKAMVSSVIASKVMGPPTSGVRP